MLAIKNVGVVLSVFWAVINVKTMDECHSSVILGSTHQKRVLEGDTFGFYLSVYHSICLSVYLTVPIW